MGRLVEIGVKGGRTSKKKLKIGIYGEFTQWNYCLFEDFIALTEVGAKGSPGEGYDGLSLI